jgi:hypothetical protein
MKHGSEGKNPSTLPDTPCDDPGAPKRRRHSLIVYVSPSQSASAGFGAHLDDRFGDASR